MSAIADVAERRTTAIRRYEPGRAAASSAGKLSSNEAPLGPAPAVRAAVAAASHTVHRYASSEPLRAALAARLGIPGDRVVLTSGSDELCYLLATLFVDDGDRVVLSRPCYQIDELVTRVHRGAPVFVDLREDGSHDLDAMAAAARDAALLWLPTPHNPTGAAVAPDALVRLLGDVPERCLVVLDEAYRAYADPALRPDVGGLLERHPNLVVQRTFSKDHALAGLRVGYGLAAPEVVAALDAIRPPFNVNTVAVAAAVAALDQPAWRAYGVELVRRERDRLERHLAALGFEHHASQANFVTARIPDPEALHARLAAAGQAIRDGADLGLPGWVRISVGAPPQMAVLRAVLTDHKEHLCRS
ncbi:MAG TPA: aminotransferase class I/II-fold pyridoxal phosphate-dependent enzyme [Baekduia sp.]|nr:aminotransferase class I/II-fold pyridoxal phosphate-dependent enzyme [Baekduia sp.]